MARPKNNKPSPKKKNKSTITITKETTKRRQTITIRSESTTNSEEHQPQPSSIKISSTDQSSSGPGTMEITLNMNEPMKKACGETRIFQLPRQNVTQGDLQSTTENDSTSVPISIQPNSSEISSTASSSTENSTSASSNTETSTSSSESCVDEPQMYRRLITPSSSSNSSSDQAIRSYRRSRPTYNSSDEDIFVQAEDNIYVQAIEASGDINVDRLGRRQGGNQGYRLLENSSNSDENIKDAGDM